MAMSCASGFPASINKTLANTLNTTLSAAFDLSLPVFSDQTSLNVIFANLYCSGESSSCFGICPNADLAGVGVRTAFWLSSILQAILVLVSPEESTQGAWTSAVLTMAILIPAIKQKREQSITIYHATLVLNFATFSSLVSLSVAPMCAVWRKSAATILPVDYRSGDETQVEIFGEEAAVVEMKNITDADLLHNLPRLKVHRERLSLSLALLAQVSLQWAWTVFLLTDPEYSQTACSATTRVMLFVVPFSVQEINHKYYILWPLWLLFHVSITAIWGLLLVVNSAPSVHPVLSRQPSLDSSRRSFGLGLLQSLDWGRIRVLTLNGISFLLAVMFIVVCEVQANHLGNCTMGENTEWSFGQIAAILVAMIPAWPIAAAIGKRRHPEIVVIAPPLDDCPSLPAITDDLQIPPFPPGTFLSVHERSDSASTISSSSIELFDFSELDRNSVNINVVN